MMNLPRLSFLLLSIGCCGFSSSACGQAAAGKAAPQPAPAASGASLPPNIVFLLVDDMGYGDLSCFRELQIAAGATTAEAWARYPATPNIDRLAREGVRLTQYYAGSPVCSPSRVAITTGQFPARQLFNSYLDSRASNRAKGMRDFLDPAVPTLARTFQQAGYATAHFGKWHMGGGRDVDDAPLPQAYGFDESLTSFEGLGDRVLPPGKLSDQSAALGHGNVTRVEKHELTPAYIDRTLAFIEGHKDQPFFVQVWFDDVHDPHQPSAESLQKFERASENPRERSFFAVLTELDKQVGRVIDKIDQLSLGEETLIILTSDNGPTAWPSYYQQGLDPPGSTAGFRGRKWSLYEGGIRMPFIARQTGRIPAGSVNSTTVLSAVDLFPSLVTLAGIDLTKALNAQGMLATPSKYFDGSNLAEVFVGQEPKRTQALLWEYGRDETYNYPGRPLDQSPNLAIRDGDWKLLINDDGSHLELYDLSKSPQEYKNVAGSHPEVTRRLSKELLNWRRALPVLDLNETKPLVDKNREIHMFAAGQSLPAEKSPKIAGVGFSVEADVTLPEGPTEGVVVAQGGNVAGYAIYVRDGKVWFTARVRGQQTTLSAPAPKAGEMAVLAGDFSREGKMRLRVNGAPAGVADASGPIPNEPGDGLEVGRDTGATVGDYTGPFAWNGTIRNVTVLVDQTPQQRPGHFVTEWAGQMDPANPLPEYPRPQLVRDRWLNLNGYWNYAIIPGAADGATAPPEKWEGRIVVPFCAESALSGVNRRVSDKERLWYRRTFTLPADWRPDERVLLHFGAVDWQTTVWVNGVEVGRHQGGYDPFTFDVTDALAHPASVAPATGNQPAGSAAHEIVVSVWDPTDTAAQPRGKQVQNPRGIWYTPVTGIWQTVWLEPVAAQSIHMLTIVPDIDRRLVRVTAVVRGGASGATLQAAVADGDRPVGSQQSNVVQDPDGELLTVEVAVPGAKLWSPSDPFLYSLRVTLTNAAGQPVDVAESYFGMRKIAFGPAPDGRQRLLLNNQPLFQLGPLDQGWWPDGLYTAPTDEALRYDIEFTKRVGFNMARKHVKVEPARWYYWCDKLGLLVWQDMPSGGLRDRGQMVRAGQADAEFTQAEKDQFRAELHAMIAALQNSPAIVAWVPFNEGWGQHDTNEVLAWVKGLDPTRLVNGPSGWEDRGAGDMKDMHRYPGPEMFPVMPDRVSVLGEFGGLGWPVEGHLWIVNNNWGYRTYHTHDELLENYSKLITQLPELINQGLAAAVYTQTTDVEIEVNGLMTYDRRKIKLDPRVLATMHAPLYSIPAGPVVAPSTDSPPRAPRPSSGVESPPANAPGSPRPVPQSPSPSPPGPSP